MRTTLLMSAFLAAAISLPASAMVQQIGAVNVANDHFTTVAWKHFEGPVQQLQFLAQDDDVTCDHIDVTYRDGTTHRVWAGTMARDGMTTITFPEGDSRMKRVDFTCRAHMIDGARIALSAISQGWDTRMWERTPHVVTQATSATIER